mgnify:CR=1 FL=1
MPTNHTPHYNLNQWERDDRILMEDFNEDNAKIDAALKAEAEARTALAAQVAKRGNCKIWNTDYMGTGTYGQDNPTSVTFPELPLFALITTSGGAFMLLMPGSSYGVYHSAGSGSGENSVKWSGNTVTWYASTHPSQYVQLNVSGVPYYVFAFYLADQS